MKTTIVLLLAYTFLTSSVSAWELDETTDAMTDEVYRTAFVKSNNGSKFTLIRKSDNRVWGYLKLSGMSQFKIDERLMLRIDKNDPVEYNEDFEKITIELRSKIESWEWNPDLIGFLLWHGKIDEGCGMIQKLYDGEKMVIRYHPNKSTTRDVHFDISKNKSAIPDSLKIKMDNCGK